jgi:hypothetical protein
VPSSRRSASGHGEAAARSCSRGARWGEVVGGGVLGGDAGGGDEAGASAVAVEAVGEGEGEVVGVAGEAARERGEDVGGSGAAASPAWAVSSAASSRRTPRRRSPMTRSVSSVTTQSRPPLAPSSSGTGLYEKVW